MKRRDLERHLSAHGCRQVDAAGTMLGGSVPRAHDRSCRAIARSTTDWRARSAGNWLCHLRRVRAEAGSSVSVGGSNVEYRATNWFKLKLCSEVTPQVGEQIVC